MLQYKSSKLVWNNILWTDMKLRANSTNNKTKSKSRWLSIPLTKLHYNLIGSFFEPINGKDSVNIKAWIVEVGLLCLKVWR